MLWKLSEPLRGQRAEPARWKAEMLQNLVNWLLMEGVGRAVRREPLLRASGLSTVLVVSLNLQLKQIPGGRRDRPTASQTRHPEDTAASPHISIMWLLCPFYLCSQLPLCVCEECGALLRGFAFLPVHLDCLRASHQQMGSRNGWDGPQTQVWGRKRGGEVKGKMSQRQRLRTSQCLGTSADYPGAIEGGFSWLSIWNMSWEETRSTEGDRRRVSD